MGRWRRNSGRTRRGLLRAGRESRRRISVSARESMKWSVYLVNGVLKRPGSLRLRVALGLRS